MVDKNERRDSGKVWVMADTRGNVEFVGSADEVAWFGAMQVTKHYNDFIKNRKPEYKGQEG